jgi:hypothetical protein
MVGMCRAVVQAFQRPMTISVGTGPSARQSFVEAESAIMTLRAFEAFVAGTSLYSAPRPPPITHGNVATSLEIRKARISPILCSDRTVSSQQ